MEKYKKIKQAAGIVLDAMLALIIIYAAVHLLRLGTVHYRPESQWPLGIMACLPVVLRPRRRATAPELLVHDVLVLLGAASFALMLTEYVAKGGILIGNNAIWQGFVYHAAIFCLLYIFIANIRLTVCIGMAITLMYALADHYVLVFRGMPMLFSDVLAVTTGLSVANSYSAPVELSVLRVVGIAFLFCLAVWRLRRKKNPPRRWQFVCSSLVLACWLGGLTLVGNGFVAWRGNLDYSELYYFIRTAEKTIVHRPDGYSTETLRQAEEEYTGTDADVKPNIIMIMNESFADLGTIGEFATNEDYMPFIHSLAGAENTISGELLVSIFGGGTATTEFEVLTGSSMAFLPFGSSPYQMYIKQEMPGLVSGLAEQGYETVAMHPYYSSSWNRSLVYQCLGFESQLYESDFDESAERLRSYISDSADYQKIIELYEEKNEGTPFFMFNVTMQNHGGYDQELSDNFDEDRIHLTGEYEGKYPQVDQYLSLVRYSDDAVRELVEYFSQVDEPTAIIFFGDHQPNVTSEFYDELMAGLNNQQSRRKLQNKLHTPFFIWANYDIEEKSDVQISANYLSAYALDALDCATSGYDRMRLSICERIPRINNYGFFLPDGEWRDSSETENEDILTVYRDTQYALIFDRENREDSWYEPGKHDS